MSGQKPPPGNLQGILKFCIENTAAEDRTTTSDFHEMSAERKAFLQKAIEDFLSEDETLIIKKCLEILVKPDGTLSPNDEEELMTRETALDQIEGLVDNIDSANDCHKLGGFDILLRYLDDSRESLQWRAAAVLGLCFQNNTYSQDQALKLNIMPKLLDLIHSETSDDQVNVKSLFALAGLVRAHREAENVFLSNDGISHLLRVLERNIPKLNTKAIFLISNLIEEKNDHIETLYNMGIISRLVTIVQSPHDRSHEHALNILLKIVTNCPEALEDCRQEMYGLQSTLNSRKQYLNDNDPLAYAEELALCNKLLKLCFDQASTDKAEVMDR